MFLLEAMTTVKFTDVEILSQKNRAPDDNPGVKISVSGDMSNDALSMFDGFLKSFLFAKGVPAAQTPLDGVAPISDMTELTTIAEKIGTISWALELTGFAMVIDYGMGGPSNLELEDVKLLSFRITAKRGGTVTIQWVCESEDVAERVFGKLATLKSREVKITLLPPEVVQEDIEPEQPRRRGRQTKQQALGAVLGHDSLQH